MNFTQLEAFADSTPRRTRVDDTCNTCGATVRRIVAGEVAGWPAITSEHPVDRLVALALVALGRPVYVRRQHKRSATWVALDADCIGSPNVAKGDHYPAHVCGHDPPPRPRQAEPSDHLPATPPF
jgi:hypothetical protein